MNYHVLWHVFLCIIMCIYFNSNLPLSLICVYYYYENVINYVYIDLHFDVQRFETAHKSVILRYIRTSSLLLLLYSFQVCFECPVSQVYLERLILQRSASGGSLGADWYFFSFQIILNLGRTAVVFAILVITPEMLDPRYLKLLTASRSFQLTLVFVEMPWVLFAISLVFTALISMPYLEAALAKCCTRLDSTFEVLCFRCTADCTVQSSILSIFQSHLFLRW